ncbi:hypothetical protein ABB37_08538 [Leptomonas pyrrhocoris]|uniref:Uncharacterized protein n=1 Tax=Leptomonas pyrrhocoris TaxID=157538 RepID=A0A0M9FSN3_LEPPY|nr:hypothetical protein ABB37_08538 [Leptomonas pyrrhocoris]KPA75223.1 hypothetical protein ABB37_08538 [Leptomonas pyrrhocoris]|eukprot:XP_015653662.1 hypothetical protein ABB37_08538 [Leptomonas pyrrhocoris]
MAALLRKLHGSTAPTRSPMPTATSASPTSVHTFLIEVIAFGEVYAVPVTKATPATVVLRYVMEAAVSPEDAAQLGNVEATLYYKEKPLPLDTVIGTLPKRAVLHLHSSLSATSSVVRDRSTSAVSMLPLDRQRYSRTTVTMQPVLKEGSRAREGSGSTTGGLSSEGRSSPSAERHGSSTEPIAVDPSVHDAGMGGMMLASPGSAPMMVLPPMMVPMVSPTVHAGYAGAASPVAMMPYYYCMPMGPAGSGLRVLGAQGRTVSATSLSASRRRDSAVEFANSYHFPPHENPLSATVSAAANHTGADTPSPRPSPAGTPAARRVSALGSENYLVVYLRLPRNRAAACLSAAALSADGNIEVEEVAPDEVPLDELLNATFSTVATNKSQLPRAYAYRRLRVRKDFPVGTLRELCAVSSHHRLHLAHKEVADEGWSFAELEVPTNAVFYFKAPLGKDNSSTQQACTLTRERLKEHLNAGTAAAAKSDEKPLNAPAGRPLHVDAVRPSLDRSPPTPAIPSDEPHYQPQKYRRHHGSGISAISSITSSQSIHERIEAFNEGAVHNTGYAAGADEEPMQAFEAAQRQLSPRRYVVEGKEAIITSAVAAEQARCSIERVARLAEAAAEEAAAAAVPTTPQRAGHRRSSSSSSSRTRHAAGHPVVWPVEKEEDVDVDVVTETPSDAPAAVLHTARGATEVAESRHPLSASIVVLPSVKKPKKGKAPAGEKDASRTSSVASLQQRGPHPTRLSRVKKTHREGERDAARKPAAAFSPTSEASKEPTSDLPCTPFVPKDVDGTAAPAATVPASDKPANEKSESKKLKRSGTPASLSPELRSRSASAASSRHSSRSTSVAASLKASFQRLTKRTPKDGAAKPNATASPTSKPMDVQPAPTTTADEESLSEMQAKSERQSRKKAKRAAAAAATAANITPEDTVTAAASEGDMKEQLATKADHPKSTPVEATHTAAVVHTKKKVRRSNGTASGSAAASTTPSPSYSERRRQSADAVPRQPVAFLGADPAQQHRQQPQIIAASTTELGATPTASTLEEVSATLGPAALSTTRIPSPRSSPAPVSILVSPSLEQRRRSASSATPASRAVSPDCSVESTGSLHHLRITIKDPVDSTRFHYCVPVEPECPVAALREWISAMQPPSTVTGVTPPSLRNVDRYGVFAGDTYLHDEGTVTFGDVTRGRNDVIFSIRRRF